MRKIRISMCVRVRVRVRVVEVHIVREIVWIVQTVQTSSKIINTACSTCTCIPVHVFQFLPCSASSFF